MLGNIIDPFNTMQTMEPMSHAGIWLEHTAMGRLKFDLDGID